jgi:serine/threonine-protein kinase
MTDIDLFLSHSSGDAGTARELRGILEDAGYRCWMAPDDVTGTESWAEQILAAIEGSRAMIVLISSNANRSPHVSREVNLALGRKRAVLPIRIENVPPEASLEYLLSLMQRIDAFPPPISDHADRILRRIGAVVPHSAERTTEQVPPASAGPAGPVGPMQDAETARAPVSGPATMPATPTVPVEPPTASAPEEGPPAAGPIPEAAAAAAAYARSTATIGAGSRVGGFTIDSVLGEGGMATVYRATQEEPRRSVALKLIRADHAADPTYRQRFLSEKDTLARLEHPGIVPIYAAGDADGVLYIAMRLVDGPDLAARLAKEGRLSLQETIATLRPIADAIDYAHEMGVIHRDLKPSNVILDRRGRPYLTDFGLGKQVDRPRDISIPGVAIGTLDYMAPEQFSGIIDPALAGRTDVYALGCVAFTCLTGAPPFRADEPERVMYGHLHGEMPNLRERRPDLPPAVDTAIRRALAKNPADRHPSADAFLQALTVAASISEERTAPIVVRAPAGSGGVTGWIRTHALVAGAAASGIALITVGAVVLGAGGGGATPSSSPGPDSTLTAGGNGNGTAGPSGGLGPTFGPPLSTSLASISPTLTPPPINPPTPTPGPTADRKPPTGADITITANTVFAAKATLELRASGATEMRIGNAASETGNCAWSSWRDYSTTVTGWSLNTTTAGTRWVCAEFRDDADNRTATVRDSVYFDHPPTVSNGLYFSFSVSDLDGEDSFITRFFNPSASLHIAEDADGLATLKVTKLWLINGDGSTVDYTSKLTDGGTTATFDIPIPYCGGYAKFKYGFTVSDSYTTRDGFFYLEVCTS